MRPSCWVNGGTRCRDGNSLTGETASTPHHQARMSRGLAVGALNSVRVRVARFCLLKFRAALGNDQRQNGKLFGFPMDFQLEAIPSRTTEA